MTSYKPASDWEKRFDKRFGFYIPGMYTNDRLPAIKAFIHQTLAEQKLRLVGEIREKMPKRKVITQFRKGDAKEVVVYAEERSYNQALDDLTQILDSLTEEESK